MDFLQRTPFFRLLLPFVSGIFLFRYIDISVGGIWAIFFLSIFFIFMSFVLHVPKQQFKFRWLFGCGIFLFFVALAYPLSLVREKGSEFDHLHQKGIYRIELTAAPIEKAKSYLCRVELLQFYDAASWSTARGKAYLYLQKDSAASRLLYGDRLMLEAEFTPPEKAQNPDGFDYAAYLKRQGIGASCYVSSGSWQLSDRNERFSLRREADKCRNYLLNVFRKFKIQGDEFAVLAALTLGYTDALQPDLRKSYSATGAMHILSVSGLHVGVVYVVMMFLLGFLDKTQRQKVIKTIFIMLFLWAYAFLTGLSPAVIRATFMFTFISIATCFERKSQIYNTIFMSVFFMLLINPNYIYDIGFQLSYSAVLSIVFFQPPVSRLITTKNKVLNWSWDLFAVSIAAQLGTAPFTLYYFHQFPNYFLLTNLVAIPLSSVVIYLAMGLLMVSFIPYLSVAVAFLLNWSLWLLNSLIVGIQHMPYSVSLISLDIRQMIVLFIAIFCLTDYFYSKRYVTLTVGLMSVLVACLFNLQVKYETLTSSRMIVYAGQKNTQVNFIIRNRNYVFTTDSLETLRIAGSYWQNQKLDRPIYLLRTNWFIDGFARFEGVRILILTSDILKKKTTASPMDLDFLIIGKGLKPKIEQILDCVHPRKVIVDKSISSWYTEHIKRVCVERQIDFYSLAEKGAYILNFAD